MKTTTKVLAAGVAVAALFGLANLAGAQEEGRINGRSVEVTIQNISKTVITPPFVALNQNDNTNFFETGSEASVALEELAEGGSTAALADYLRDMGIEVVQLDTPILPGESVIVNIPGRKGFVSVGAMLLPTNDAFTGIRNLEVRGNRTAMAYGGSYDAGTEANDELCGNIPGPQCGGEGFNADRSGDVNFIHPHPTLHGNGDVSELDYNWAGNVIKVTAKRVR